MTFTPSPEQVKEATRQFVSETFPSNKSRRINALVEEFNMEGQGNMLGVLEGAHKVGKLDEALDLLEVQYREHWSYYPKELRGSFITVKDEMKVRDAYKKLAIPLPTAAHKAR